MQTVSRCFPFKSDSYFQCAWCPARAKPKAGLLSHQRSKHKEFLPTQIKQEHQQEDTPPPKKKPDNMALFPCEFCPMIATSKIGLLSHVRHKHKTTAPPTNAQENPQPAAQPLTGDPLPTTSPAEDPTLPGDESDLATQLTRPKRPRPTTQITEESSDCIFKCHICPQEFPARDVRLLHIRLKHPGDSTPTAHERLAPTVPVSLPTPALTYTCNACQRSFTTKYALSIHTKWIHTIRDADPTLRDIDHTRQRKRQRSADSGRSKRPSTGSHKVSCGECGRMFSSRISPLYHCRRFHNCKGVPIHPDLSSGTTQEYTSESTLLSCPKCNTQCLTKKGLSRHLKLAHDIQPTRANPRERTYCDETSLHLLICPALKPLRKKFAVDGLPTKKLCFAKEMAQFLLAVESLCQPQLTYFTTRKDDTSPIPPLRYMIRPSEGFTSTSDMEASRKCRRHASHRDLRETRCAARGNPAGEVT